jgi:uncharacterized YccA/Bax inhibitor family protein
MRSGNPALNESVFRNAATAASTWTDSGSQVMTLNGVVLKTGFLLALLTATAIFTWQQALSGTAGMAGAMPWMIGGLIAGTILALVTVFKPTVAPWTAPLYAACEGLALGGISAIYQLQYGDGIVVQAVGLTFGTLAALLATYSTGLIKPSESFKLGIVAATGGIALLYVASFILGFFGMTIPLIGSNGPWGIAFSGFVVVVAALNLVLDFDFIENGVRDAAPKYMEWYAGFGLLVTLVWLYLAMLRLLAKLQSRD